MVDSKIISKGIIYIIEHNDKPELKYIGQTKQSLGKRFEGHVSKSKKYDTMYCRLMFLLNYYGIDNFSIRELKLFKNITQEQLDSEEIKYINVFGTMNTKDANEKITIKITNEMKNDLLNRLILNNTCLENINKLIDKFSYDYQGNRLDFIMDEDNQRLINIMNSNLSEIQNDVLSDAIKYTNKDKIKDEKTAYEKQLDRVNSNYRTSKIIMINDYSGNHRTTTEAREQKRLYYHKRDKYELCRKRILREYHNSLRKITQATIEKYRFTEEELKITS